MSTAYPSDWNQRRKEVYRRDDYECQNCGAVGGPRGDVELHAHHVVPKASGGTHQLSNLQTVCEDCHQAIHNQVQAPTARATMETGDSTETGVVDKMLFSIPVSFNAIRVLLGETKDEDPFNTTHQQFGYLFYARTVFFDAHSDIMKFALADEVVPEKLERRYTTAQEVMRYVLGKTDEVEQGAMLTLIDVAGASDRPHEALREVESERELNEMDTVYELITDWKENTPSSAPQEFIEFLNLTETVVQLIEEEFEIYQSMVVVREDGVATLSESVEGQWKEEVQSDLQTVFPKWSDLLSDLSNKGVERAKDRSMDMRERVILAFVAFGIGSLFGRSVPMLNQFVLGVLIAIIVFIYSKQLSGPVDVS